MYFTDAFLLVVLEIFSQGVESVSWPDGSYALPMSVYGCPDPSMEGWEYGYLNISFRYHTDLYERRLGKVGFEHSLPMLVGPYGLYSFQLNFCSRWQDNGSTNATAVRWPPGKFTMYAADDLCPPGFSDKNVAFELPEIEHINKDGRLPRINVTISDSHSSITFLLCVREATNTDISLELEFPFIVLTSQDIDEPVYFGANTDIINEHLYFLGSDRKGNNKIFDWLSYMAVVPRKKDEASRDCFDDPFLYNGNVSTTVTGYTCKNWTEFIGSRDYVKNGSFPDGSVVDAQNYCRSPEHAGYDPWCFTENPKFQWEYCGVRNCEETCFDKQKDCAELDPLAILCPDSKEKCRKTCNNCVVEIVNIDCFKNPFYYAGNVSTTTTGYDCQPWTNFIGQKSYILDSNFPEGSIEDAGKFCRSPDSQGFEPYCFTTNPEEAWEYCDVKQCDGRLNERCREKTCLQGFPPGLTQTESCYDEAEDCTVIADAREMFCEHYKETCAKTCGLCASSPAVMVRLVGGTTPHEGRVELRLYNHWGTICDDGFNDDAATVLCHMMGYARGGYFISNTMYSGGQGPIWLDNVVCTGTEETIFDCTHSRVGIHDCTHIEDVAIQCMPEVTVNLAVRLVGGSSKSEGRVEVLYSNEWTTICDDYWTASEAAVVCRMLGLPHSGAVPLSFGAFGPGSGTILMNKVNCNGTEISLEQCRFKGWDITECNHTEDAAVICQSSDVTTPVRLSGSEDPTRGAVEVYYNNTWGSVCDDYFDSKDATVLCRMLGFSGTAAKARVGSHFGEGLGPIWLDNLQCEGTEPDISLCGHRGWGTHNCDHSEDAGVICHLNSVSETAVRLVDCSSAFEGRLEVYHNDNWGNVCDNGFDTKAAAVVCKMLGLPSSGAQPRSEAFYGQGNLTILLDSTVCDGSEPNLGFCDHLPWGETDCTHAEDVGVLCAEAADVPARLVNGSMTEGGRLELFYNGSWGSVCDDLFTEQNAKVACRMLGYSGDGAAFYPNGAYGSGTGSILLDNIACSGQEYSLVQCHSLGWNNHNCDQTETVGVSCISYGVYQSQIQYWLVYDLGQSVVISHLQISGTNLQKAEHWIPQIFWSQLKWNLHGNGAIRCLSYVTIHNGVINVQCQNDVASPGRYLYLKFNKDDVIPVEEILKRNWLIMVLSEKFSSRCGQTLGMGSRVIEDYQISSSSTHPKYPPNRGRPYDTGWCADHQDASPYLQVDFLRPVQLEGIQILNWEESGYLTNASRYSPYIQGMGVYSFTVEYSVDTSEPRHYKQKQTFRVDRHLPFQDIQTFMFASHIVANVLRVKLVSPIDSSGLLCLRIEIIGCQLLDPFRDSCGEDVVTAWHPSQNLYISPFQFSDRNSLSVNSLGVCQEKCQEMLKSCAAVVYKSDEKICHIHETSETYSYQELALSKDREEGFIRKCIANSSEDVNPASLLLSHDNGWNDITTRISQPGIMVSHGYPYHYTPGMMWLWEIAFDNNAYVGLLFPNISFNIYQEEVGAENGNNPTFLDKQDRLFILRSSFELDNIFTEPNMNSFLDEILDTLGTSHNKKRAHYRTNENKLRLLLRTTSHDVPILEFGNGFRALAFASELVTCLPWEECSWKDSVLSSGAFLGDPELIRYDQWEIVGDGYEYIVMNFTEFFVVCDTSTEFEMNFGNGLIEYCNMDMPKLVASVFSSFEIHYQLARYPGFLLEGFQARYQLLREDKRLSRTGYSLQNDSIGFYAGAEQSFNGRIIYKFQNVCSEVFNKCYVFVRQTDEQWEPITWNRMRSMFCTDPGYSPLTIQSEAEQAFIGHYVQQYIQDRRSRNLDYLYIGLYRELVDGDLHVLRWSNGKPVTFTSWSKDQPSTTKGHNCGRMNITSLTDDYTWDLIPCDEHLAGYSGCELPYRSRNISLELINKNHNTSDSETVFAELDMSVYFPCDGGIISFLGVCNGYGDCYSGEDEHHCSQSEECSSTEFKCSDGQCISVSLLCDFHQDCLHGEDEECYFEPCAANEFRCDNGQCIDNSLRCDSKQDCVDATDEKNCVEIGCNNGSSFLCGDAKCVPRSRVCDGTPDCVSGEDENQCMVPETCQQWWSVGYQTSGIYKVYGMDMECDFSKYYTNSTIITRYAGIDIRRNVMANMFLRYKNTDIIERLHSESTCYQSLDQLCQPWFKLLYDIDTNKMAGTRDYCQCVRYKHWLHQAETVLEDCDGNILSESDIFHLKFTPYSSPTYLLGGARSDHFNADELMMRITPIVCFSDFIPGTYLFGCGDGITAPLGTKCLYNLDDTGNILGCRNLAHLQDCATFDCPEGYVKCHHSFCLEKRFVCDGEQQCPHGEDEQNCDHRTCVGEYRCLESKICLATRYLCDSIRHCPLGDDERLCHFRCPESCSCHGLSVDCTQTVVTNSTDLVFSRNTRQIDVSSNAAIVTHLYQYRKIFVYLSHLNISYCHISDIDTDFFHYMRNLLTLDLRHNNLDKITSYLFSSQSRLKFLYLDANRDLLTLDAFAFTGLKSLEQLKLSHVHIAKLTKSAFYGLNIKILDLSYNNIEVVDDRAFEELFVDTIYLNRTRIKSFKERMFEDIHNISTIVSDAYKFCCIRPSSVSEQNCYPRKDEFSSCADLMRNDILRPLIWIIGSFALLGNILSLVYRFMYDRGRLRLGYGIFVTNLAVSDFLMGAYMITIASADVYYRGRYIFFDEHWRESILCKLAGVTSTVASEASVLFLCLITLDRLFVIKYPFGQVRFTPRIAGVTCLAVWIIVGVLAAIPLLVTSYFQDAFYSKSGVCLALPLTRDRSPGWIYSISIFIIFNSAAFLLIAFGQWSIYREIDSSKTFLARMKSMTVRKTPVGKMKSNASTHSTGGVRSGRNNDLRVARNLLLIVSTDFLCWCPIGILGILAMTNHVIPGEVYAWIAVVVLPINSALNPFLYTFSAIFGKKKFVPDTLEQTRKEVFSTDHLTEVLSMWKSNWFFRARLQRARLTRLQDAMTEGVSVCQILQITVGIAKQLHYLHQRGLAQKHLEMEDIYVRMNNFGQIYVVLDFRPMLVSAKETEKSANIERLGSILATLLLHRRRTNTYYDRRETSTDCNRQETNTDSHKGEGSTDCNVQETSLDCDVLETSTDSEGQGTNLDCHRGETNTDCNGQETSLDCDVLETSTDCHGQGTSTDCHGEETKIDCHKGETSTDCQTQELNADFDRVEINIDCQRQETNINCHNGDTSTDCQTQESNADFNRVEINTDCNGQETSTDCHGQETNTDFQGQETDIDCQKGETSTDCHGQETSTACCGQEASTDYERKETCTDCQSPETSTDCEMQEISTDCKRLETYTDCKKQEISTDCHTETKF